MAHAKLAQLTPELTTQDGNARQIHAMIEKCCWKMEPARTVEHSPEHRDLRGEAVLLMNATPGKNFFLMVHVVTAHHTAGKAKISAGANQICVEIVKGYDRMVHAKHVQIILEDRLKVQNVDQTRVAHDLSRL